MPLHEIEARGTPDEPQLAKRRRWFAPWLIGPGNLYLQWSGCGVMVLSYADWKAREDAMHRTLHGIECPADPRGWVILPRWPGVVLSEFGGDFDRPPTARLQAVSAASRALSGLHRASTTGSDGILRPLSHGDATCRNVVHDPSTSRSVWFDFDTAHDPTLPAIDRHADDLRALVFSAVTVLADLPVRDVFEAVLGGYDDPDPWRILSRLLARGRLHSTAFHLAQAAPSGERRGRLERMIRELGENPGDHRQSESR